MKNFFFGVMSVVLFISLAFNGITVFLSSEYVYVKNNPSSIIVEVTPEMMEALGPQQPVMPKTKVLPQSKDA
jgi:hypothetical protein